jgi:hypothetical protein
MNAFPTRIESAAGRQLSPTEIFAISRQHEVGLSRMLTTYISVGLAFMLLPGTFLGVWNLFSISGHSQHISAAWMQAHGQAQIFGWVGTFILGIGFYSIPKCAGAAISESQSHGSLSLSGRVGSPCDGSPTFTSGTGA